jgi:hypothetical protein
MVLLALLPSAAVPQPKAQKVPGFRLDGLQAKRIEAPTGTPAQLHWVLPGIPTDQQVIFPDSDVKDRVIAELRKWRTDPARQHSWVVDGTGAWNLLNALNASDLKEKYTFDFAGARDLLNPPRTETSIPSTFELSVLLTKKPEAKIKSIKISVTSATADTAGSEVISLPPQKLADVATALHRPQPTEPEAGILVMLTFSKSDEQAFGRELIQQALAQVALDSAEALRINGWRISSSEPSAATRQLIETTIEQRYEISGGGFESLQWPDPAAHLERSGDTDWNLRIKRVQPVRGALLHVGIGNVTAGAGSIQKLQQKADVITARLIQRYEAELARLRNRVVTRTELEAVTNQVAQFTEIQRTVPVVRDHCTDKEPGCMRPALVLEPVARWNIKTLSLKGDGALSPEEFVTGQFKASGDNLMSFRESESASLGGGPETQKASASLDRQWTPGNAVFGLHGGFNWLNDFSQRLGGLNRILSQTLGPKYEITDWTAGPKTTARWAPALNPMPNRKAQWRPALEAEVGFEFRDTELRDKQLSPARRITPESGSTAAIVASVGPRLRRESFRTDKGGLALIDFSSQFGLRKAFPAADFAFTQWQAALGLTMTFGARRSTDFLLRHRRGLGVTNGPAPLFQLFRLGGTDSVRGIEQGEYVGRYHAFEQSEVGVAIQRLIEVFRPPKPPDTKPAKPDAKPQQALPFNLATTYVKVFYDRGAASNSASAADLVTVSHAAHGYGVAAEVSGLQILKRRASLTIGYGYSPQSFLHGSGMVITGVSIDP